MNSTATLSLQASLERRQPWETLAQSWGGGKAQTSLLCSLLKIILADNITHFVSSNEIRSTLGGAMKHTWDEEWSETQISPPATLYYTPLTPSPSLCPAEWEAIPAVLMVGFQLTFNDITDFFEYNLEFTTFLNFFLNFWAMICQWRNRTLDLRALEHVRT